MKCDINDLPIPTWTTPEELEHCAEVAKNSTFMVESGCFLGASAKAILEGNPQVHLWTVDHFKAFAFNKEVACIFLHDYITQGRCEIIEGDMDRAGNMLLHMRGEIDAVWIDDGHAEIDLQRDIRNAIPLLKPGGILFGHDWDGDNDVARGVLSMLPMNKLTFPVPRVWQYQKP